LIPYALDGDKRLLVDQKRKELSIDGSCEINSSYKKEKDNCENAEDILSYTSPIKRELENEGTEPSVKAKSNKDKAEISNTMTETTSKGIVLSYLFFIIVFSNVDIDKSLGTSVSTDNDEVSTSTNSVLFQMLPCSIVFSFG
jgi:hypothetical protein